MSAKRERLGDSLQCDLSSSSLYSNTSFRRCCFFLGGGAAWFFFVSNAVFSFESVVCEPFNNFGMAFASRYFRYCQLSYA